MELKVGHSNEDVVSSILERFEAFDRFTLMNEMPGWAEIYGHLLFSIMNTLCTPCVPYCLGYCRESKGYQWHICAGCWQRAGQMWQAGLP